MTGNNGVPGRDGGRPSRHRRGPGGQPPRGYGPDGRRPTHPPDEALTEKLDLPIADLRRASLGEGADGVGRARPTRVERRHTPRRRSGFPFRRVLVFSAVALVLVVGSVTALYFTTSIFDDEPADFAGPGQGVTVIEVAPGDTAEQISRAMVDRGVTASTDAFYRAAIAKSEITSVQPGFYRLPQKISGTEAVRLLIDPSSRVGQLQVAEGRQLHDTTDVKTNAVKKGIYTLISEESCKVGGGVPCVSVEDLDKAGSGDGAGLGVPEWARDAVAAVPQRDRQLEGLIAAGTFNFDPTASATKILAQVIGESTTQYEQTGLLAAGAATGLSPYQVLVASSLVQREALPTDFAKVARVILNRLAVGQKLEFDSTVNYSLDTTEVATTPQDRARVTPWNTYAITGLPATPICSPSVDAVRATEAPEPGNWLYFVTINARGTTLFTDNYEQHLRNIGMVEPGFLASGR